MTEVEECDEGASKWKKYFPKEIIPFVLLILMTGILLVGLNPELYRPINKWVVSIVGTAWSRRLFLFGYVSLLIFFAYNVLLPIWSGAWFKPVGRGENKAGNIPGCVAAIWSLALAGLFIYNSISAVPFLWDIHVEILEPYLGKGAAVKVVAGSAILIAALGAFAPETGYRVLRGLFGLPGDHRETAIEIIHNLSVIVFFIIVVAMASALAARIKFF
ncbi:hypothetical protein ACFLQK_01510 [bacterium]